MQVTYTFCPICGRLADDVCQVHPDCAVVTEAHHPDDYATVGHAQTYARRYVEILQDFHVLLSALTILRAEHGCVFRAEPYGLRRVM